MRKTTKHLVLAAAAVGALLAMPALYAYADANNAPRTMGQSMTGGHGMMGNNMMGSMMGGGSMMGMGHMRNMAEGCGAMMTSMMTNHGLRPNEQWKQGAQPQAPSDQHQRH